MDIIFIFLSKQFSTQSTINRLIPNKIFRVHFFVEKFFS